MISAITGIIAWMGYRATRPIDWPIAKLSIGVPRGSLAERYVQLVLTIENPTTSDWTDNEVELLHPRGVGLAKRSTATFEERKRNPQIIIQPEAQRVEHSFDEAFAAVARQRVNLRQTIEGAGSYADRPLRHNAGGWTDEATIDLLVARDALGATSSLTIRVYMQSNDARPRKHTVTIKRAVPAHPSVID